MESQKQIDLKRTRLLDYADKLKVELHIEQEPDILNEIDSKLSFSENKRHIREFIGKLTSLSEETCLSVSPGDINAGKDREIAHLKKEEEKAIKKIKANPDTKVLDRYYADLRAWVRMVTTGHVNGLVAISEGGFGKSYQILAEINKTLNPEQYEYINSYATPLEFVNWLYEHKDKEVLILDDLEGLLDNKRGLSILKAVLWSVFEENNKQLRVLNYLTTSKKLQAKGRFEVKARFIFCMNSIPQNKQIASLISRCVKQELVFSYSDKIRIFYEIAKIRKIPTEIVDYIKENSSEATENFNIRTLIQIHSAYRYNKENWKERADSLIKPDRDKKLLLQILNEHSRVKDACKEWVEATGHSRRQFFYMKKALNLGAKVQ